MPMIPLQGILTITTRSASPLCRREEADDEKRVGEEGGFQRNEVHAHLEKRIPSRPVVQHHVVQCDAYKDVVGDHETSETGHENAEQEHPQKVSFVACEGIRLQSPHALGVKNGGHQKADREGPCVPQRQDATSKLSMRTERKSHSPPRKQVSSMDAKGRYPLWFRYFVTRKRRSGVPVTTNAVKIVNSSEITVTLGNLL